MVGLADLARSAAGFSVVSRGEIGQDYEMREPLRVPVAFWEQGLFLIWSTVGAAVVIGLGLWLALRQAKE